MKKNIEKGQLVGYWTIFTNIILVVTTFWLGLVVQDFVAQKNANVSAALARAEYVKNVKPSIDSLNVNYNSLICDINDELKECMSTYGSTPDDAILAEANEFVTYFKRIDSIVLYYDKLIETSNDVLCYIDDAEYVGNSNEKHLTGETTTDFDQLKKELEHQNLVTKIGVLYAYKEMLDFCFLKDSLDKDTDRTMNDWIELDKRLKSLYRNPKFVSIMGLTMNYDQFNSTFRSEYEKIYNNNDEAQKVNAKTMFVMKTFYLALDIHKILSDNRTYKQKEISLWNMVIQGPWGILFFGFVITWLFFTIIVLITRGRVSSSNQVEGIDDMRRQVDEQIAAMKRDMNKQIETLKISLSKYENDSKKSKSEIQNELNNIKSTIDNLIESIEGVENDSEKTDAIKKE